MSYIDLLKKAQTDTQQIIEDFIPDPKVQPSLNVELRDLHTSATALKGALTALINEPYDREAAIASPELSEKSAFLWNKLASTIGKTNAALNAMQLSGGIPASFEDAFGLALRNARLFHELAKGQKPPER